MGTEPTLAEIIREAIASHMLDVHVAMPAEVVSFDRATGTCEVKPKIRRAITDTAGEVQHEELPNIPNVPVHYPRSAVFSMTWDLVKGDHVLLVFNSSAIGNWRETGDLSDPGDLRRHDLSYPVAFAGIAPKGDVAPSAADAAVLEVEAPYTHVQVGAAASEFVARADKVESLFKTLADAIVNAVVAPNDGGATLQTNAKAALVSAGWTNSGTTPPANSSATAKLKSE